MRLHLAVAVATIATLTACAQSVQNTTPKTDDEKALYALGVMVSTNLKPFEFTDKEIALVKAGIDDGARGRSKLDEAAMEALVPKLQELQGKRIEAAGKREKEAGTAFLAKAATEKGAKKLASGLIYTVVKDGTGETPKATDTVKVIYEGKLLNGTVFDSTAKHPDKAPSTLALNQVIPCWTEALQQMKVGGKAHLVCPSDLAYGEQGHPPQMPANATLLFDVELLEIVKDQPAAPGAAPSASAAPAAGAAAAAAAHKAH